MKLDGLRGERSTSGRLTGALRKLILPDTEHPRGQRLPLLSRDASLLTGFELNGNRLFGEVYGEGLDCIFLPEGQRVWLETLAQPGRINQVPEGATHVQLVLSACVLSDYRFAILTETYGPVWPELNGWHGLACSELMDLKAGEAVSVLLGVDLPALPAAGVAVVVSVGIRFYSGNCLIKAGQRMKIVKVF